jgi:16S rRNA (guanine966-N2)-methyltransferase
MLFSRLGELEGLRVADLYAGSGALGLEALSRGAASATFVETDREAIRAIEANLAAFGARDQAIIRATSAATLPREQPFDLIFADPPYAAGSGSAAVRAIAKAGWLAPGGWIAVESNRSDPVDPGEWLLEAERDSARARLTLIRRPA